MFIQHNEQKRHQHERLLATLKPSKPNPSKIVYFASEEWIKPLIPASEAILLHHLSHLGERRSPLLIPVEAPREICEEPINSHLVYPVIILGVWVLVELEVQKRILVPESIRMHLHIFQKKPEIWVVLEQITAYLENSRLLQWGG